MVFLSNQWTRVVARSIELPHRLVADRTLSDEPLQMRRWAIDSLLSLGYASSALRSRGDLSVGLSNAGRGLIERAHAVLASRSQWVLNEKGMVDQAGLTSQAESLMAATDAGSLLEVVDRIRALFESSTNQESR